MISCFFNKKSVFLCLIFLYGCGGDNEKQDLDSNCSPFYVSYEEKEGFPKIELQGDKVSRVFVGDQFIDSGVSAFDDEDGDISHLVTVEGLNNVDTSIVGDYLISYNVSDSNDNKAYTQYRFVRVVDQQETAIYSKRFFNEVDAIWEFYEKLPPDMGADHKKYPLIIYNHGYMHSKSFDQGQMDAMKSNSFIELLESGTLAKQSDEFIILAPQRCSKYLNDDATQSLNDFLSWVIENYPVDSNRIYMTGLSNGGFMTWDYAKKYPTKIAAIAPMVMGYFRDICPISNVPVWAFTAKNDDTIPYMEIVDTIERLNNCPGNIVEPKVTVFEDGGHIIDDDIFNLKFINTGDANYQIYDTAIYDWFLQFKNSHLN